MFETVYFQVAAILALATLIGGIGLILRQPLIVSFIAVGLLCGPEGLGLVGESVTLKFLADLGIALLLFVVGLKLDIKMIRTMGPVALATGLGQVAFTSIIGFAISILLGMDARTSAYVAVALTFSSTIIIVKLLTDKKEIDSLHGKIAVGFLIVQDIMVVVALIALSSFGTAGASDSSISRELFMILVKGAAFIAVIALLMRFAINRLTSAMAARPELLVLFSVTWAVILAESGYILGFSHEVGAFIAGVSLASTPFRETIGNRLTSLRDFLLLFFFIQLGGGLELSLLGSQLVPAAVLSIFVLIGNPVIVMVIMGAMGYRKRTGFLAGLTVAQISEFSLVLGALGVSLGHLSAESMGLITLVGLITIAASTYMILYSYPIYGRIEPFLSIFERKIPFAEKNQENSIKGSTFDIILLGLGRFGNSIARRLFERQLTVLGVDFDPEMVAQWRANSYPALYGDMEDPDLLEHLPLHEASWVIVTIPMREGSLEFIRHLRRSGYGGKIAVTVSSRDEGALCREAGANLILRPYADAAEQAADSITSASDLIQNNVPWPISLEEVRLNPGSILCGRKLREIDLRNETGASIVAVSRSGKTHYDLHADFQLFPGDRLLLAGDDENIRKAQEYMKRAKNTDNDGIEGGAVLSVETIKLTAASDWAGRTIAELDLRRKQGITLIALKRGEVKITAPRAKLRLMPGDILFVLKSGEE